MTNAGGKGTDGNGDPVVLMKPVRPRRSSKPGLWGRWASWVNHTRIRSHPAWTRGRGQ